MTDHNDNEEKDDPLCFFDDFPVSRIPGSEILKDQGSISSRTGA